MVRFKGIDNGRDRARAQAYLNNYNAKIAAWQRQADALNNHQHVNLRDYIGFSDEELADYTDSEELAIAIDNRVADIEERVSMQRERMRSRNRQQSTRVAQRARKAGRPSRGRGRPSEGLLTEGQYVYFAVAYNHGMGAGFLGYGASESSRFDPTPYEDWEEI